MLIMVVHRFYDCDVTASGEAAATVLFLHLLSDCQTQHPSVWMESYPPLLASHIALWAGH